MPTRSCSRWMTTWSCTGTRGQRRRPGVGDAVSLQRTDLALWSLDAQAPGDHLPPRRGEVLQRPAGRLRVRASSGSGSRRNCARASRCWPRASTRRPGSPTGRTVRYATRSWPGCCGSTWGGRCGTCHASATRRDEAEWMLGNLDKRQVPAAVHAYWSHLRPVRGRDLPADGRRRCRIPPDRAGPDRGTAGGAAYRSLLAADGAASSSGQQWHSRSPKLPKAAFRAPDRSMRHRTNQCLA